MLVHNGTSHKKWGSDGKIVVSSIFKDEKITKLDEIKYLETRSKKFLLAIDNENDDITFNVLTQKGVKCFGIVFTATRSAHTPDEIKEAMEKFEKVTKKYAPFYDGLLNEMG